MKRLFMPVLLAAFALFATGMARAQAVPVVASFSILADLVEQVGGEHVQVYSLVGPDQDAHVFQPRPSDAARIAQAKLVVINGLGFEGWITRLVQSAGYRGPVRAASDGIATRGLAKDEGHDHDHENETVHAHDGKPAARAEAGQAPDPHAWQDPRNVVVYVRNIAAALAEIDPANASSYARNAQAYTDRLQELDQWVGLQMADIAPERRKVITSHEAMRYFGARYGVEFVAPQGMSTASEPGAREVAGLIRQIRKEKVKALFLESITNPMLLQQIAAEAGVSVGGRLYSDALSAATGPAPDYIDMIRYNVTNLRAAMLAD